MCHRKCLQTEPISCCFNTKEIILIQQHKAAPKTQQSDEGHYDSGIKSTIDGIDMKLFIYFLNANRSQWSQHLHPGPTNSMVSMVLLFYLNCVIAPLRLAPCFKPSIGSVHETAKTKYSCPLFLQSYWIVQCFIYFKLIVQYKSWL